MTNLLKTGSVTKECQGLTVDLYQLSGDARPKVDEVKTYRWVLSIRGNSTYYHVEELRVEFSFINEVDTSHIEIIDYIPRREKENKATLELNVIPQIIKVDIPINSYNINTEYLRSKIVWIFGKINLSKSENIAKVFEGVVTVRFHPESLGKKVAIAMNVIPIFYKKKISVIKNYCNNQPKINDRDVIDNCNTIIPGDSESGYADVNQPDEKRTLEYNYIIDQGILEKGSEEKAIRNVALRARTLAIFFNTFKENLPEDLYRKLTRDAGKSAGMDFLKMSEKIIGYKPTFNEWLNEWIKYDSTAGWGRFEITDKNDAIFVENSFVAYKIKSDIPICYFLEGYFEEILSKIFGRHDITVTETDCIAKGDKKCKFVIK